MAESKGSQMARIVIPDIKAQKCIVLSFNDTVWAAKQLILDKIFHDLPKDPLNYSLYLPASGDGKLGKFLDDGYLLSHYAMQGNIPRLEMRYKKRDYSLFVSLSDKAIAKANSKPNQKKLAEYLISGSVKKVEKLLESGLDPNYVTEDGNTPLGIACGRNGHLQCIMPLLSGGAHIDFRGKDGLTPMHRAAIGGNAPAVNVLLSYRASPNYRDAKGLTPIFHTAIMGDDTAACATLLRHRAELGCTDHGGWTELHHAAKYGHCKHVDLLIRYGADINAQNLVGNTPLHVAASHGQSRCALLLLKRGAKQDQSNFAGQTPSQVAILCGHHKVSGEISAFDLSQIDTIMLAPEYNPKARIFAPATFAEKKVSELCPVKPPVTELAKTLNDDWQDKSLSDVMNQTCPDEAPASTHSKFPIVRTDSTSTNGSASLRVWDHPHADTESISSAGSGHSGSSGPNTPMVAQSSFQQQRERLYRAGAGKYVVVQDVYPQAPGDIPLRRGMPVEVMFVGKGGYWEGRAGGQEGWFPCIAIKEVASNVQIPPPTIEPDYPTITQQVPLMGHNTQPAQYIQPSVPAPQPPDEGLPPEDDRVDDLPPATAIDSRKLNVRNVTVVRGGKGYGFAMRGVRATKAMQFHPSPQVPALQYIGNVEPGGAAAVAGLCTGDFLLEVNGHNVTYSTHDEVVSIVRKSGGTLHMKVITPMVKPKSVSQQIKQQMTPVSTPEGSRKSSITSKEESPKPIMKSSVLGELKDGGRETVIGRDSNTLPRSRGSPAPPRISRSGWDSSQEDISTGSLTKSKTMKAHPILQSTTSNPSYNRPAESYQIGARSKSFTLPPPDYPKAERSNNLKEISESDNSQSEAEEEEAEEEESSFAKALRERKNELAKRSAEKLRLRAYTMPEKDSPLLVRKISQPREAENNEPTPKQEEEPEAALSPLQMELLKASKKRSERLELKQPRMTKSKSESPPKEKSSVSNNPLAKAISERINSLAIDTIDDEGDDFESSPGPSPVPSPKPVVVSMKEVSNSKPPKAKLPPPTVRPKPSKKSKPEADGRRSESPVNVPAASDKGGGSESPFKVKLRNRGDRERSESPVNFSGNDEDGRASPLPFKVNLRSRSETGKKVEKKKGDADDDGVTVNWKSVLKPAGGSGRVSPVVHVANDRPSPKPGVMDTVLTPDSGQAGSESQFTFEAISPDFTLPPPLPADEDNRISFIDLEPPEAFFVEGVESNADSGVAGDLPVFMSPTISEGLSIPPPIPSSSPPEIVPDPSPSAFVFPDFGGDVKFPDVDIPEPKPVSPMGSVDLPSPLPSPTSRSSSRIEDILHLPIPPPVFGDVNELPDLAPPEEAPVPAEGTSESKTSLDSDMSDTPPPPPPSEPPPFMDINESVDIIDASIKSLEELDGFLLQEPPKADPAEPEIKPAKVKAALEPTRQQLSVIDPSETANVTREPAIGSRDIPSVPTFKPAALYSEPPKDSKEAPPVTKKPPPVQTKSVKSPPPESIESRVAPEGTAKPKEGFSTEEKVQSGYKGKPIAEWDIQDVCQWLRDIGLGEHASMFEENEIIGEHLLDFGKDDLKELGMKKLGHQKTFTSKLNLLL